MSTEPDKNKQYLAMRRRAHRLKKQFGGDFTTAYNQVAREAGFRDAAHAVHWQLAYEVWGPCDPPTTKKEDSV